MYYCLYVNNEVVETDLTRDEALVAQLEILEEDPEAMIRIEPMDEGEEYEYLPEDEEDDEDEDDLEDEEESE